MGRNSPCEGFPSEKNFQEKIDFPVARISQGEGFPGGKDFLVEKMFTFITKLVKPAKICGIGEQVSQL